LVNGIAIESAFLVREKAKNEFMAKQLFHSYVLVCVRHRLSHGR